MIPVQLDTAVLVGAAGVFALILMHAQRKVDGFDLRWLIVDSQTEKVSLMKFGQLVALCVTTWILIHETRSGKLTEWLFAGYCLTWAGVNLAGKWINASAGGQK